MNTRRSTWASQCIMLAQRCMGAVTGLGIKASFLFREGEEFRERLGQRKRTAGPGSFARQRRGEEGGRCAPPTTGPRAGGGAVTTKTQQPPGSSRTPTGTTSNGDAAGSDHGWNAFPVCTAPPGGA